MWQQTFCLLQFVIITGSLFISWDMKVSQVVNVSRGEDAVLSCSFSHPRQRDYSGMITVKWLARESYAPPFFSFSIKNHSTEELNDWSISAIKYSLKGDPRQGDLSLLIRKVHISDNGTYFCRTELDGWGNNFQRETHLYVTVKPQILSLSVIETTSSSDRTERRLQCEVEGHPLPTITWLSASGGPSGDEVQTSRVGLDRLVSSVPYLEKDEFTCRVMSMLGRAERRYPESNTLMITLTVCGLITLLLLLTGLFFCRKTRAAVNIQANADVVEKEERLTDCPADGDAELQLIYSTVSLTPQHVSLNSRKHPQDDSGVIYSPVNFQL